MGYYIETTSPHNKAATILARVPGTHVVQGTPRWEDLPEGKAYVCVVDNRIFEAAAFVYNESEYVAFTLPENHRSKTWLRPWTVPTLRGCQGTRRRSLITGPSSDSVCG